MTDESGASARDKSEGRAEREVSTIRDPDVVAWAATPFISKTRFVPGTVLADRYRIVERLGRGGMGEVYRAEDLKLDMVVALKFLPPGRSRDPAWLRHLHDEVRVARQVAHPHVCRVYDIAEVDCEHFISMEYIDGEDLAVLLRRIGQLPGPKAIQIARQLCLGLAAAHDQGVLHRDLKPANIMLDESGNVRITDFGIAALLNRLEDEDTTIGSPAYMAPEQIAGGELSQRTDLYALGLVFYEMFTGTPAIDAACRNDVEQAHAGGGPVIDSTLLQDVDPAVVTVISHCLKPDPQSRPHSARAVLDALPESSGGTTARAGKGADPNRTAPAARSIAVLPFADMSPEKDQGYFCDGMAEEILNGLSRLEGVQVASRTSAFQFKDTAADIRKIGERLNVNAVLEGSVRKAGDRLRVTAQLINVSDGYHLWSDRYDRTMADVFDIQDEIAQAIVKTLQGKLATEQHEQIVRRYTQNVDAYELYLKGRYVQNTRSADGLAQGIEYFKQAIAKDSSYALAYAGLADSYSLQAWYRFLTPREAFPKAGAAAAKALSIDETLPEAHTSQGVVSFYYDWEWEAAGRSFSRALELNPRDAVAMHGQAEYLAARNRLEEAQTIIDAARRLEPLSPTINAGVGWIQYFSHRYEDAIRQFAKTLELDPDYVYLNWFLAQAYLKNGMPEEAVDALRNGLTGSREHPGMAAYLAHACAVAGRREEAQRLLDGLQERSTGAYVPADYFAVIHIGLGQTSEALKWLDKACAERALHLVFIGIDPLFDSLRSEPAFQEILRRIGLEQS